MDDFGEFPVMRQPVARIQILDVAARYEGAIAGAGKMMTRTSSSRSTRSKAVSSSSRVGTSSALSTLRPIDGQDRDMIGTFR